MTCSEYLCAPNYSHTQIITHIYINVYLYNQMHMLIILYTYISVYIIIYTSHVYRYGVSMGMDQTSAAPHGKLMSGSPHST
jgi:hypothetical protein